MTANNSLLLYSVSYKASLCLEIRVKIGRYMQKATKYPSVEQGSCHNLFSALHWAFDSKYCRHNLVRPLQRGLHGERKQNRSHWWHSVSNIIFISNISLAFSNSRSFLPSLTAFEISPLEMNFNIFFRTFLWDLEVWKRSAWHLEEKVMTASYISSEYKEIYEISGQIVYQHSWFDKIMLSCSS